MAEASRTGDEEFGRRIAERRERLGMSRRRLAEETGLSYPYIAQIETGYRLPATRHHQAIVRALGMSLDELFGTEELATRPPNDDRSPNRPMRSARRRSTDEAVEHAVQEIQSLPASVRLEALAQVQFRIMQGMTGRPNDRG